MTKEYSKFYEEQGYAIGLGNYENDNRLWKVTKYIQEYIKDKSALSILDLGCGDAKYTKFLKDRFDTKVIMSGCDVSERIIQQNRNNNELKDINFITANLNQQNSIEGKYDIIIAGELIEHLENTDAFMASCHKALTDNGLLIVTTPNLASWLDRIMLLFGMQPFSTEVAYSDRMYGRKAFYKIFGVTESQAVGHLRLFTVSALKDLAEYHSFNLVKHIPYYNQKNVVNKAISNRLKNMAEGMIMIFTKETI